MENKKEIVSDAVPEWQLEMDKVGFVRKIIFSAQVVWW